MSAARDAILASIRESLAAAREETARLGLAEPRYEPAAAPGGPAGLGAHDERVASFTEILTGVGGQVYHARSAAHAYDVLHADEAEDINYFLEDAMARAGVTEE